MKILVYTPTSEAAISSGLGLPEYSYYFVLKGFLPLLREFGEVIEITDPNNEVDKIYNECLSSGEKCQFIQFLPPNRAFINLSCPTFTVFAWEFNRIPDEVWSQDSRDDWKSVLRVHGKAIVLSDYAASAVRDAMGNSFHVSAIPVPVWQRMQHGVDQKENATELKECDKKSILQIDGNIFDSRNYKISPDYFDIVDQSYTIKTERWNGDRLEFNYAMDRSDSAYLGGFYKPETWGAWSRIATPWVLFPYRFSEPVCLLIEAYGYGLNVNKEIRLSLGSETQFIELSGLGFEKHKVWFLNPDGSNMLRISGLDLAGVEGAVDPRSMGIALRSIEVSSIKEEIVTNDPNHLIETNKEKWNGDRQEFSFASGGALNCKLIGFYERESWGAWSQTDFPVISLPMDFVGYLKITMGLHGYAQNAGKKIRILVGSEIKTIKLPGKNSGEVRLKLYSKSPVQCIAFCDIDINGPEGGADPRTMGIGLRYITIEQYKPIEFIRSLVNGANPDEKQEAGEIIALQSSSLRSVEFSGVVYTSVFNPADNRKNWVDIITAFCFAFRGREDATLILKMTHKDLSTFLGKFHFLLEQIIPDKCRVIVLHGYMPDSDYKRLIDATHFYVNASRAEGLCLPLMEFKACGVPSICPQNTAMNDYISADDSIVVDSSLEPGIWPHDPRAMLTVLQYRISWESLVKSFEESYEMVRFNKEKYACLSLSSREAIKKFSSDDVVREKLEEFFSSRM